MTDQAQSAFRLEGPDSDGVAVIWFDRPDKKVNTLSTSLMGEFEDILKAVKANKDIKAGVLISGKENSFIAGADIDDLNDVETADDGTALSKEGQRVMDAVEDVAHKSGPQPLNQGPSRKEVRP